MLLVSFLFIILFKSCNLKYIYEWEMEIVL